MIDHLADVLEENAGHRHSIAFIRRGGTLSGLWDGIDRDRRKTGGSWASVNSLRLHVYSLERAEKPATIEVNINTEVGVVVGVRLTESGAYPIKVPAPFLFMTMQHFFQWLINVNEVYGCYWDVWGGGDHWYGYEAGLQQGLDIVLGAFIKD